MKNIFPSFDSKKSISENELDVLKFWKENEIFEKSVERRNPNRIFNFFDGPPFATGSPHYGHILAGAIKDAIPRYKTMQGYRVERKWGWDCHGVPVEFQVEKEHRIGGKPGIEKMGVGKFNELCRSVVMRCADEWESTVDRMGRFVDFKNDYKTMDPEFMESVWWVFGELWKKGLIYEGEKVVSYSPKLGSPLSNFEANLNYKDIDDPAVTVKFELQDEFELGSSSNSSSNSEFFLAWTTTPWTLPSNLALAVNPKLEYVKVRNEESGESYWMSGEVLEKYDITSNGDFSEFWTEEDRCKGKKLIGKKYKPLFPFFENHENAFRVLEADYVSAEEGTGIVHQAPNFGEDDARICHENNITPLENPIDEHGFFNEQIPVLKGKYFRDDPEVEGSAEDNVNKWVLDNLGTKLFQRNQIRHSYPHCWRTDCALMYRGIKTWFVDVGKIKKTMIEQNQEVNWVPEHLKDGRFGKMLADAPDWAISRNRYWGTPIPAWRCDGCGEVQVVSSRSELEKKSGEKVEDLHKHFVDDLSWKCEKCTGETDITFIRHGATDNNDAGKFQGSQNIPLNDKGRAQAEEAREKFKDFDVILSAPLNRATETAKILFENAKIEIDERLREKNHGDWEGMTPDEILKEYPQVKTKDEIRWSDAPNGDSFEKDLKPRVREFLQDVQKKYAGKRIAVITHRATLCALREVLNQESFRGKTIANLFSFSAHLKPAMKRIPEVLDCWFESGSMPYASQHYPFNQSSNFNLQTSIERNGEKFEIRVGTSEEFEKVWKWKKANEKGKDCLKKYLQSPQETLFLCFMGTDPVGHLFVKSIDKKKIDFHTLEFDKKYRGLGLGTEIFNFAEQYFSEKGFKIGTIGAYEDESKNQKRYEKWGFQKTERTEFCDVSQKKCFVYEKKLHSKFEDCRLKIEDFKPADFIAEGLDQTRGWFYTLHVLGCALFGKNIFKNVITNGIVLAEDGKKMSKKLKNYPDPNIVFDKYGADAIRFYMLNSPVVRGENFRFAEHGVEEVLKQIILPLRSSYQFFSTYANIDNWQPTKVLAIRHGEADHNVKDVYSSGEIAKEHHLTSKGKAQIQATAKILPDFDVLIASPLVRAQETATLLAQDTKFSGEILTDQQIREIDLGNLEGKKYEGREQWTTNKTVEKVASVQKRMRAFFDETVKKYAGKTICIVSHGDPIRELEASLNGVTDMDGIFNVPMVMTGTARTFYVPPTAKTELDQWILSELQTTLDDYRKHFDAYDLEGALKLIPGFIDNLNNWYLRRSRRRFWANGMNEEKQSGYETLHYVLLTLAKMLAPVCPFFAEDIFKKLGGGESVHLEFFPVPQKDWQNKNVEKKIHLSREIVSLAAGIRARAKIKLRQPLAKLQFVSTDKADLDFDILREEANVKEIEQLKSVEGIAQQVVRVDAKKVGPRLGKKVQEMIAKGKSGAFELLKNGDVKIADEVLTAEEFSFGFVCDEGVEAEATARTVVILNTEVSEDLEREGMAREIIRTIQELRKKKDFEISDRISIRYSTDSKVLKDTFSQFESLITGETLAEEVIHGELTDPLEEMEIDEEKVTLDISKI
jgi:isoleucyl-tRNA synthetase/GNAT superfamily N-acetyltransferase